MLKETADRCWGSDWRWLCGDGPDGQLGASDLVSPLDYSVWRFDPAQELLEPRGVTYRPDDATLDMVEQLCRQRLARVIASLPQNQTIRHVDRDHQDNADDVLFSLPAGNKAVMNPDGFAAPKAAVGQNTVVGTDAAATCVAVLGRVRLADNRWRMGCTHLSEVDLESFDRAWESVHNLLTAMASADATANAGHVELYLVGGRDDDQVSYQEFSRLAGAIQAHMVEQTPANLRLAGAVLPANPRGYALAVYINGNGVYYTSEESSSESDGDGSGSD